MLLDDYKPLQLGEVIKDENGEFWKDILPFDKHADMGSTRKDLERPEPRTPLSEKLEDILNDMLARR